jgi:hypothetical protein
MTDRLLELARVRTERIQVKGEWLTVTEPSALQLIERRQRMWEPPAEDAKEDAPRRMWPDATERALAYLIAVCVKDETGELRWSEDDAMVIATGRADVAMPIINSVTGFLGKEKKDSLQTNASGIDSPSLAATGPSDTARPTPAQVKP